jgi:DNA-binding protein YbaB
MFDKFKQLNELRKMRSQAMELQKELEKIKESAEKNGMKVVVTGDQKIAYIEIDGVERKDLVDLINEAIKKVQKVAAKKMMEMGGGLSGLLGGGSK